MCKSIPVWFFSYFLFHFFFAMTTILQFGVVQLIYCKSYCTLFLTLSYMINREQLLRDCTETSANCISLHYVHLTNRQFWPLFWRISLSIRVQTIPNHWYFLRQYRRQIKRFFQCVTIALTLAALSVLCLYGKLTNQTATLLLCIPGPLSLITA